MSLVREEMNITQIRRFATKILERLPKRLREALFKTLIETRFLSFRIRVAFSTQFKIRRSIPDPSRVYWISPERIIYHTNYRKNSDSEATPFWDRVFPREMRGRIINGNWDITNCKFTDLMVYKALRERILRGGKWEDTEFYRLALSYIKCGRFPDIRNEADLKERCKYLDSLCDDIRTNGYRLNRSVRDGNIDFDEINVNIGRNGEYLFQNGAHRLSIAKTLGLKYVPVMVFVRHKKWQDFRKSVSYYAEHQGHHRLYEPIVHPDLADIPYDDGNDSEGLMNVIKAQLGKRRRGIMLDMGANLGYFCHKFEEMGYKCYAIEKDPMTFQILEKIRIAENKQFVTINASVLDTRLEKNIKFDVVLALNVFHHFLKTESSFSKLKDLLAVLQMDTMFFEPHNPEEPQMKGSYVNYDPTEFVDFILTNTSLRKSEDIYTARNGRTLFKLSK
jgi:hypothetical protein